ncbi:MAG: hypothetical protein K0Q69_4193 [Devosia sp.]|jgi:hypothetical protein|nr:hypothetical protein [Devosia sp.]RYE45135.1 MAG: hypothetical protein EOP24_21035 [Hyphomicrobiales bacterium]
MSDPQDKPETTPALTPEAKAVLARARKSFMVSMGLLVVGLIAIGGALVYRASQSDSKAGSDYVIAALKIPAGGEVVSAVAADGRVTVTYKLGPITSVRIFDGKSGEMIREVPVVSE